LHRSTQSAFQHGNEQDNMRGAFMHYMKAWKMSMMESLAFSSEVDTGSREENASKEDVKMPCCLSGSAAFSGKLALVF
jgi:hypothetical protein